MDIITTPTANAEAAPKKRGRKPLSPEERARRKAARQAADAARRRAMAILAKRYETEFNLIVTQLTEEKNFSPF